MKSTPKEWQYDENPTPIQKKDAWGSLEAAQKHALPHQFIMAVSIITVPNGAIYYNITKRIRRKHCWGTEPSVEQMERHNAQYEGKPIYFIADDEVEFQVNAVNYVNVIPGAKANHIRVWTAQKPTARQR